jgi:hypothetical protein
MIFVPLAVQPSVAMGDFSHVTVAELGGSVDTPCVATAALLSYVYESGLLNILPKATDVLVTGSVNEHLVPSLVPSRWNQTNTVFPMRFVTMYRRPAIRDDQPTMVEEA